MVFGVESKLSLVTLALGVWLMVLVALAVGWDLCFKRRQWHWGGTNSVVSYSDIGVGLIV